MANESRIADRQAPQFPPRHPACDVFGAADMVQRLPRFFKKELPDVRQPDIPGVADQKRGAEMRLQFLDSAGQCWLRQIEASGGRGKVKSLRHGDETAKLNLARSIFISPALLIMKNMILAV